MSKTYESRPWLHSLTVKLTASFEGTSQRGALKLQRTIQAGDKSGQRSNGARSRYRLEWTPSQPGTILLYYSQVGWSENCRTASPDTAWWERQRNVLSIFHLPMWYEVERDVWEEAGRCEQAALKPTLSHRLQIGLELWMSLAYRPQNTVEGVSDSRRTDRERQRRKMGIPPLSSSCVHRVVDQGLKMKNKSAVLTGFSRYYCETFSTEAGRSHRDPRRGAFFIRNFCGVGFLRLSLFFQVSIRVICTEERLHFIYSWQDTTGIKEKNVFSHIQILWINFTHRRRAVYYIRFNKPPISF